MSAVSAPHADLSLSALSQLSGLPLRTIRFYIERGLVDRPEGAKRGAYYTQRHVEQLVAIRRWQDAGLSLERIAELLTAPPPDLAALKVMRPGSVSVRSHVHVAPGIELSIDPELAHLSPERLRALTRAVLEAWQRIAGGASSEDRG